MYTKFPLKVKVFYGQEPPSGESTTTECGFNYQPPPVIYWSSPNGELLVAVNNNQQRTMASEKVDTIDWPHPPPYNRAVPLSSTYCTLQCGLGCKSQDCCTEWAANVRPSGCQTNALPMSHSQFIFKFIIIDITKNFNISGTCNPLYQV